MKILIVATTTPVVMSSVNKIMELPVFTQNHQTYLCLLEKNAHEKVDMPQGLSQVLCLPSVESVKQAYMYLPPISDFCKAECIDLVLFYSDKLCHQLAIMLSRVLNCECFTEIKDIKKNNDGYKVSRKVYDSNINCIFPCTLPLVATVARGKSKMNPVLSVYETVQIGGLGQEPKWVLDNRPLQKNKKSSLEKAKLIFVAGRGIGSEKNLNRLANLAKRFNASFGVTRSVVLSGWAPMDLMIGQSGTITSPEICVTFGVSGAAPFIVGVEQANTIIAINNDTSAAIFHTATYGIVKDCSEILTGLEESLEEKTNEYH